MKRVVAIAVVALVLASCSGPTGSQAPTVDVANPCDDICLDSRHIVGQDRRRHRMGRRMPVSSRGYLTAWLVRTGGSLTKLTTGDVDNVGVPQIVIGDRAAIIATVRDRCRGVLDHLGTVQDMEGPKAFSLPSPGSTCS